ncbi:hypothetical protein NKH18_32490 [Streptomyces sp. M10(2022)]
MTQSACDASRSTQLWNLWADTAKGEAALRDDSGTRYLGLVEWARADKDQEHGPATGTTRYYYGSDSMRFRFDPALLGSESCSGAPERFEVKKSQSRGMADGRPPSLRKHFRRKRTS